VARDRFLLILFWLLVVLATSSGIALGYWYTLWGYEGIHLCLHICSGLFLFWSMASYLISRGRPASAIRLPGGDMQAVFLGVATATGLPATMILLYAAVNGALLQSILPRYSGTLHSDIGALGFMDLGMLLAGTLISLRATGDARLVTAIFWLVVLFCSWGVLFISGTTGFFIDKYPYAISTSWTLPLMGSCSVILLFFCIIEGVAFRRRRFRAWPDQLRLLTERAPSWPGFRYSAGIVAVGILILGCINITNPWTTLAAFCAGVVMLVLMGRQWNENFADIGMALITLGVISGLMIKLPKTNWGPLDFPMIYNRALIGLGIMTFVWYWLAGVWKQQLDGGRAWTATGRMIRASERVGFLMGATGVLVSLHLCLWPRMPFAHDFDMGASRLSWGVFSNGILLFALLSSARRSLKQALVWLSLFVFCSIVGFIFLRTPDWIASRYLSTNWPIFLSFIAVLSIFWCIVTAGSRRWNIISEPFYLTSIFLAPIISILGIALTGRMTMLPWVPSVTFGLLACVYLLAAFGPGPKSILAVAYLCAFISIWNLQELTGSVIISLPYFYGTLAGAVVACVAHVFQGQTRPGIIRLVKWAGIIAALTCAGFGFITSHT